MIEGMGIDLDRFVDRVIACKNDRSKFLEERSVTITSEMTWKIVLWEAKSVDGDLRVMLTASVGADKITPPGSRPYSTLAVVHEIWSVTDSKSHKLLRRAKSWVPIDTKLSTPKEN